MVEHQRRPRQHPRLRPRPAKRWRHQRLQVQELRRSSQRHPEQPWQAVPVEKGEGERVSQRDVDQSLRVFDGSG